MDGKQLLGPTILAGCGLLVSLALGTWQLQRLQWKEGLVARIAERAKAEPVSLASARAQWRRTGDVEYLRLRLEGTFHHTKEAHVFTTHEGRTGWRVVTAFETQDAVGLVDRGFVPDRLKAAETREAGQIAGLHGIVGLARAPERQLLFTPDNEPERNIWFWRDIEAMASSLLGAGDRGRLVPFFIEAEDDAIPGGWPRGGVTRLALSNRHLGYALTWYGLAGALVLVYSLFVRTQRARRDPPNKAE